MPNSISSVPHAASSYATRSDEPSQCRARGTTAASSTPTKLTASGTASSPPSPLASPISAPATRSAAAPPTTGAQVLANLGAIDHAAFVRAQLQKDSCADAVKEAASQCGVFVGAAGGAAAGAASGLGASAALALSIGISTAALHCLDASQEAYDVCSD
jgi:hypothetical protein